MFYEPKNGSGLPHNPLNAIVVPRPIGWISTLSAEGVPNLAPYSFFNAVAYTPPQVMFSATSNHQFGGLKDAVADAQATGEFVVNVATWELREQMNASAVPAPHEVDEFEYAGLTRAESRLVRCPRVAESPVHLECRYTRSLEVLSDDAGDPTHGRLRRGRGRPHRRERPGGREDRLPQAAAGRKAGLPRLRGGGQLLHDAEAGVAGVEPAVRRRAA